VIIAIASQSTRGVSAANAVPLKHIRSQLAAVSDAFPIAAVKAGMLGSAAITGLVARKMAVRKPSWLVVDPVMSATSGAHLLDEIAAGAALLALGAAGVPLKGGHADGGEAVDRYHDASGVLDLRPPVAAGRPRHRRHPGGGDRHRTRTGALAAFGRAPCSNLSASRLAARLPTRWQHRPRAAALNGLSIPTTKLCLPDVFPCR
jgi:hydroxymethylpyrimidine/phosphomethylpyrimidine kinase